MPTDIYKKLALHLDNLPGGFPPTKSGVELRILRRLFTPEEAELALNLTLIPEEAQDVARRIKLTTEEVAQRLKEMARKGLIYSVESDGSPPKYMALQYVIGIWEFHVNNLDEGLVRDMDEYIPTLFNLDTWKKVPQLRTVPVGRSIPVQLKIMSYEDARKLVRAHKMFLVAPCICRRERRIAGEGCDKPEESCLIFGRGVDYYSRNGIGRVIEQQEALEILKKADKAGLVLQPSNSQKVANICCCCGCCCGVLRTIKKHPKPASIVSTPFVTSSDFSTCKGCGTCLKRCQMEALRMKDEKVVLDTDRCIGCGLCVSTCPTGSLTLVRKPESRQPKIPKSLTETYFKLGRARGKMESASLVRQWLKSKKGRILAAR